MPACVVRPEVTEGPYYVNEDLNRADVKTAVKRPRLAVDVHKGQVGCAGVDGRRNTFDVVTVRLHLGVLRDFGSRPTEGVAA